MKVSIIRGAFLNPFELQNYYPLKDKHNLQAVSSQNPINENIKLPLTKLWSPTDLPSFPYKYPVLNRVFGDAHYLLGLPRVIEGSDIVHVAETYYNYNKQAISAKKQGKVDKIISTVWEIIPHNNESLKGRKKIKELSYKHIDHFIAVTSMAKSALQKEGVSEDKISVIPMGVDLHKFSTEHKKESNNLTRVLFVGRLEPEKGVNELLQAFKRLKDEISNVELVVVGSGSMSETIKQSGVQVKSVSYSQIHKEYKKADIFCLLSKPIKTWQEQYGMVLVEAMASGLPIVTTRSGAIPEVCGSAALYAEPSDSSRAYQHLKKLVNNTELRKELSEKSKQRAQAHFDHKKIAEKINHLYHKIKS